MRDLPSLEREIEKAERQLQEMKNVQFVGKSSLKGYKTGTTALYDWSYYIDYPKQYFRLRFTFDTAKTGAIVRLSLFYRINNSDVMAQPVPTNLATSPSLQFAIEPETVTDTYMEWQVTLFNNTFNGSLPEGLTAYVKFFFDATDTGTWSMTKL